MKVPLNWLRELVVCDAAPGDLAERLTFAGLEVEAVAESGCDMHDIVAAEVLAILPHPRADRLRLCDVSDGKQTVRVVCGADNFVVGDKVPLAKPGAVLAGGVRIKPTVLRGEKSDGMLCAADELGISDDHQGLMLLPAETLPGTPMEEIVGPGDHVLTIEITPNRPDCMSLTGIAREVAAIYGSRLQRPFAPLPEPMPEPDRTFQVAVEDPADCPRYMAWLLEDVVVRPSPLWMQRRLLQAGVRPINNVVDITNYVMLETGQPLHAFDRSLLRGGQIRVRRARDGEIMVTLDGLTRKLNSSMLVIADAERPVALAGIMGGEDSGIHDATRTVVLESACFQRSLVRRTGQALGLTSEATARFERGVDAMQTDWAAQRAVSLMIQLTGARLAAAPIDVFLLPPSPHKIKCRFDRLRQGLGLDISDETIIAIFTSLELQVSERSQESCVVCAPTFRPDLEGEADLLEEVARMHGLDKLPTPSEFRQAATHESHARAMAVMRLRADLTGMGLTEIMNYSFTGARLLDLCDDSYPERRVPIPNPVSAEHGLLRNSLLPQMLETLGLNRARQIQNAAFFEIGRVFFMPDAAADAGHVADRPPSGAAASDALLAVEMEVLSLGLMGAVGRPPLDQQRPVTDEEAWLWLKGILTNLCHVLKINLPDSGRGPFRHAALQFVPAENAPPGFVWPNRAMFASGSGFVVMLAGRPVGRAGLIKPELRREWRIHEPLPVAELAMTPLLAGVDAVCSPEALPIYPSVQRDLAMLVPPSLTHARVLEVIEKLATPELTDIKLFDIFKGKQIGAGYKSLAYTLTYRSDGKTLTDEEVNEMHAIILKGLQKELQVEIRVG
ncbi:MAG: phenylalanine--tRNA ligase subunit beta [Kiritimatiellia bacterium]|jgi:phenylalanyl-tRNA synthetase beta chain